MKDGSKIMNSSRNMEVLVFSHFVKMVSHAKNMRELKTKYVESVRAAALFFFQKITFASALNDHLLNLKNEKILLASTGLKIQIVTKNVAITSFLILIPNV